MVSTPTSMNSGLPEDDATVEQAARRTVATIRRRRASWADERKKNVLALACPMQPRIRLGPGSRYYVGDSLTAVDVYSATFTAMFAPLPPQQCQMDAGTRAAFETRDAQTARALDPILFEHRDMMYAEHLESPLSL